MSIWKKHNSIYYFNLSKINAIDRNSQQMNIQNG